PPPWSGCTGQPARRAPAATTGRPPDDDAAPRPASRHRAAGRPPCTAERERTTMSSDTGFLYPFLEAEERDADRLLADLAESARAKAAESAALRRRTLAACAGLIETAA